MTLEDDKKEYEKKKDFRRQCCEKDNIVDNITYRSDDYPKRFYLVLEKLDLLINRYLDKESMYGFEEITSLGGILALNGHLAYNMPISAKAFFDVLVCPQNQFRIFEKANIVYGNMPRAYADLRQYLIDNKEIVTECYDKFYDLRDQISHYGKYDKDK